MPTYRNNTTGETIALTAEQSDSFFRNRDVRHWSLTDGEGMTDAPDVERWRPVHGGDAWVRATNYDTLAAKLAEVEAELIHAEAWRDYFRGHSIKNHRRAHAAEAAIPAVYRLALGDAAERLLAAVTREYKDHRDYRKAIRALPTPTAAELMARIKETGQ